MAEDARDVLMKLEMSAGQYVPAECQAVLAPVKDDELVKGFTEKYFFAIEDFSFEAGLHEHGAKENPAEAQNKAANDKVNAVVQQQTKVNEAHGNLIQDLHERIAELEAQVATLTAANRAAGGRPPRGGGGGRNTAGGMQVSPPKVKEVKGEDSSVQFARFMTEGRRAFRTRDDRYPSDLDPVQITKRMDISSNILFTKCTQSFKFKSATIVKRKAIGAEQLRTYLRLDFIDVMLIDLNWDDDDVIKETFKFVFRGCKVRYAIETEPSTKLGKGAAVLTPQPEVEWDVLGTR